MFKWFSQGGCLFKLIMILLVWLFLLGPLLLKIDNFVERVYWWMMP
jgi:hypothetical protein